MVLLMEILWLVNLKLDCGSVRQTICGRGVNQLVKEGYGLMMKLRPMSRLILFNVWI
ncbi:MAG: hypothetical protein ACLRS8_12950 [Parabacteroides merdae]